MRAARRKVVDAARGAERWGLVLGTLGRQGNPGTLGMLQQVRCDSVTVWGVREGSGGMCGVCGVWIWGVDGVGGG